MRAVIPQLLPFADAALLCLRLIVASVFFDSGRRHAADPGGRGKSIGLPPGVTLLLGFAQMAGALSIALGVLAQVAALGLIAVSLGAIQKKVFVWHSVFWCDKSYGWHYDLLLLAGNLVILTTGGGRYVIV